MCVSLRRNLWLWVATSRQTRQILCWRLGDRRWNQLALLWRDLPKAYRRRLVYTDGYGAYAGFFYQWQHRLCEKFDGGTARAEGVNNSLRHRCGALVRRTGSRCRADWMWQVRIELAVEAHNAAAQKRWLRKQQTTQ